MKKLLNSLLGKYLGIFILVLLAANIVALILMLTFSAYWGMPEPPVAESEQFAFAFGLAVRMAGITLIAGIAFSYIATRIVVTSIRRISEVAKAVAKGDFTARVTRKSKGNDEITEFSDNINLMVAELSRNEYLHKDFVSNVSHEFKTPIAAIAGYAEMLTGAGLSDEKRMEYAEIILRQSNRLSKLSANLLRLSELENESLIVKKESFSLDEQIRDAVLLLQTEWEQKGLDIQLDLDAARYNGDKPLIYQVWVNLLSNAVKYVKEGGAVSVTLKQGKRIEVTVADNGIGMTAEQSARVFERFYKADTSRESGGTGLGLSIVKRIVEIHGGEIRVSSTPGVGSSFTVVL